MKRTVAMGLLMILVTLLLAAPLTALASTSKYVVTPTRGSVNMRSGPAMEFEVVTHVPYGAKVTVLDTDGEWNHVVYHGQEGYIDKAFLSKTRPGSSGGSSGGSSSGTTTSNIFSGFKAVGEYATVVPSTPGNFVNMRWAPSKSMPVEAKYYADQRLLVLKENKSWCQVYDEETKRCGFMMKGFLQR